MRRLPPLARIALSVAIGVAVGLRAPVDGARARMVVGTGVAGVLLIRRRGPEALTLVGAWAVGVGLGVAEASRIHRDCRTAIPDGARIRASGVFEARPRPGAPGRFRLEAYRRGGRRIECSGVVRARLDPRAAVPQAGQPLEGWGRWWAHPPAGPWPRRPVWSGTLLLDSVRARAGGTADRRPLPAVRDALQERIRRLFGPRSAMAEALLLARREGLDDATRERFVRAGLAHLLAISGLHVGLIAGGIVLFGRILRLSPRASGITAALATLAYVAFLGAPSAALRAALQVVLLLSARLLQRPADPFALLAAAALVIVVLDPMAVHSAGFQLSFAGVAGIVALRRPLTSWLPARIPGTVRDALTANLAAFAATAPVAAFHFGEIAPVGLLANLAAVPLMAGAVPALVAALAGSAVSWPVGRFLAGGADLLLSGFDAVAGQAARVPGGHTYVSRHTVLGWGAAVLTGRLAWRAARALHPRVRRWVAAGVGAAVCIAWPVGTRGLGGGTLEIHAIDVGQGDALALRSPAGRWVLVDAGPRTAGYDAGRSRVVPFLLRHGVRRLDALILTHPDADHIGGAPAVLEALEVGVVVDPGRAVGKPLYAEMIRAAQRGGSRWITARPGRTMRWGAVRLRFLQPTEAMVDDGGAANDVSVVFRLAYGRFAALFTGDAPAANEKRLVARYGEALRSDLLKVGHHGSGTSTTAALLEAAAPRMAVISAGRRNRYGHPHRVVIRRLRRYGVRVLRTDRHGTISVEVGADARMKVETAR